MDWPFAFAVKMIEIPAINPMSCMALKLCLAIMVLSFPQKEQSAVPPILHSDAWPFAVVPLLVEKPFNQSFQSRFAFRQAHF